MQTYRCGGTIFITMTGCDFYFKSSKTVAAVPAMPKQQPVLFSYKAASDARFLQPDAYSVFAERTLEVWDQYLAEMED